jgi:membrane-associated phospholipid phosphatase
VRERAGDAPPAGSVALAKRARYSVGKPVVAAVLLYVIAVTAFLVWRGISVSPDYLALIFLLGALMLGRFKAFIVDWLPFVVLFLVYELLRGFAGASGVPVHYVEPIAIDRWLGLGQIPTLWLQHALHHPGPPSALDIIATLAYFLHFAYPLTLGFTFWIIDRSLFRRFAVALLTMSFFAFAFFLLVPVAPPWLASAHGYIGGVDKIITHTLPSSSSWFYQHLNPNKVAAFPSLHTAFPVLGLLYAVRLFGKRAWLLGVWVLVVIFSIVYLGEHYVIDALGGVVFALAFYAATEWLSLRGI